MTSISYVIADGAGHLADPKGGTYKQQSHGQPANLLLDSHYPALAECSVCGQPIRLMSLIQANWGRVPPMKKPADEARQPEPAAETS